MESNEIIWDGVVPFPSLKQAVIKRVLVLSPIGVGMIGLNYFIASKQEVVPFIQLFVFFLVPICIILVVIGWFSIYLGKKVPATVIAYKLDQQGLSINGQVIPLAELSTTAVKQVLSEETLGDDGRAQTGGELDLKIAAKVIHFNSQESRQKFIRTLQNMI